MHTLWFGSKSRYYAQKLTRVWTSAERSFLVVNMMHRSWLHTRAGNRTYFRHSSLVFRQFSFTWSLIAFFKNYRKKVFTAKYQNLTGRVLSFYTAHKMALIPKNQIKTVFKTEMNFFSASGIFTVAPHTSVVAYMQRSLSVQLVCGIPQGSVLQGPIHFLCTGLTYNWVDWTTWFLSTYVCRWYPHIWLLQSVSRVYDLYSSVCSVHWRRA